MTLGLLAIMDTHAALRRCQGDGLLTLIHEPINFSRKPESPETLVEPHLEELTITTTLGDIELIITKSTCPGKLLRMLPSFPGPSDDDDRHSYTGRLQCTPLGVVLELDRYERHPIREYDIWLQLQYSELGLTNTATRQRQSIFPRCLISISLSYHFYQLEDEPKLRPSTNPY